MRKLTILAAGTIAALLTVVAQAQTVGPGPAPAAPAANNCTQLRPAEAADSEVTTITLPGPYTGPAYVLAFADQARARIGGTAQSVRSCTDPTQGNGLVYTVAVTSGVLKFPLAGDGGVWIRVFAGTNSAGKRNEFNVYIPKGKKEVTILAAR